MPSAPPMEDNTFYQLLLISGIAFAIPFVVSRVPGRLLSAVVGEIIAGIIIGAGGFDLIEPTEILDFLAKFGFAYLMFLSGLELDLRLLAAPGAERGKPRSRLGALVDSPLGSGIALLAGTFAIAFGGTALLDLAGLVPDLWLTGLILSTTSVAIVMPTLKERGLTGRPFGQTILVAAFTADIVTLLLISVYAVIKREGSAAELSLIMALPVAFLAVFYAGTVLARWRPLTRTMEELAHATAQLQVRGALALMLAFVVLAETVGSELILGSFIAGVIVSILSPEEGSTIRIKLDAIGYGFFIPIFFINVGAGLDLDALTGSAEDLSLIPIFLAIAYAAKVVPTILLRRVFSWRESMAIGFLLSSRLSLIIAASLIGVELGVITPGANSAIVLVAIVTATVSPAVFSRLTREPERDAGTVIVVGAGETGRSLAVRLAAHGSSVTLVDADAKAVAEARETGLRVVHGTGIHALREAGIEHATAFVAVTPDDTRNMALCRQARDRFGVTLLTARANDPNNQEDFIKAGIRMVSVPLSVSAALENAVLRPNLYHLLVDRPKGHDILEVPLRNRRLSGRQLRDVRLPGNCLVLLIRRGDELVVPRSSTVLERLDTVTVAGDTDAVVEAARELGRIS